jgi:hypothetical protein
VTLGHLTNAAREERQAPAPGRERLCLQSQMGGIETYVRGVLPAMAELRPDLRIGVFVNDRGVSFWRRSRGSARSSSYTSAR